MTGHPLRREIVATALTNRAVNLAGVTGLFRLTEETGVPLAGVVRAHAVARAVFGVDRMWDAVRPLDNRVSAADPGGAAHRGDPAGRAGRPLAAAAARAGGRARGRDRRGHRPVRRPGGRRARPGCPAGCSAPRRPPTRSGSGRLQAAGVPAELAADVAAAPLLPAALDLAVVAERTGAPIALAGQVQQCLAERLGLVPLRERVIALPRDRRWNSMARAEPARRPRHRAGRAHRRRAHPALLGRGRPPRKPPRWWPRGSGSWDAAQQRAAAQLADITAGDRQELAELLVAVRTLRGLHRRG